MDAAGRIAVRRPRSRDSFSRWRFLTWLGATGSTWPARCPRGRTHGRSTASSSGDTASTPHGLNGLGGSRRGFPTCNTSGTEGFFCSLRPTGSTPFLRKKLAKSAMPGGSPSNIPATASRSGTVTLACESSGKNTNVSGPPLSSSPVGGRRRRLERSFGESGSSRMLRFASSFLRFGNGFAYSS